MMNGTDNDVDPSSQLFDQLISAVTCKSILSTFHDLCDCLGITNTDHRNFYKQLKSRLTSWKAKSLWMKLDKRAAHRDYKKMEACPNTKVLVIGAGPCGLRMAIEVALMGARAVVVEKRDRFSRNNVLHLWNFVIADLRNLGAKKFFGKFCAGSIEHISIRQLQCILLKVALLLGVEVHVNVTFEELIEPPEDQSTPTGWRCRLTPSNHPVSEYQFDALIGADGKRNTVPGFARKEFRGKLAIAITANFINRNTNAEASVEEISGVAFIFNQKFFLDLKEKTGIDLENIVYYKDETHYFVMTAKKASLLEKGVLKEDYSDTVQLLSRENVDQEALLSYAKEAANFSTNHQLPCLEYAVNHYGQADIAMFDFTSMFAAENACRAVERHGHKLFIGIAGDSLLEPFWPTGSGCARGFLGVFDAAWMIKSMASGKMTPLQVIAERESIYQLLSQTTPENLHKNHNQYSIDPNTRYPNLNLKNRLKPIQVKHLYDGPITDLLIEEAADDIPAKRARNIGPAINNDLIDSYSLLRWCQRVLNSGRFRNVHVVDFAGSWRNGLAFCALIHAFRPNLLDFNLLMESDVAKNNQLAFDVAEKELGVPPVMTGEDMAKSQIPDKLTLVSYISQLYAIFRNEPLPTVCDENWEFCEKTGCYVHVTAREDESATATGQVDNPFNTNVLYNDGKCPMDRQLSYDRLPDWVRYAASQTSDTGDSEGTDSDGTTADGSITMWQMPRRHESWSDNSDSTDDEVYAPVNVKSLKRFYEGPRGYAVSAHRPKRSAVRKSDVSRVSESDVAKSLSGKEAESWSMDVDDLQFKTLTQEDKFSSDLRPDHPGDDAFKTLTQEDLDNFNATQKDPAQNIPEQIVEFKHDDMKGISEDDFKTLTQEDVSRVSESDVAKSLSGKEAESWSMDVDDLQFKTLTQEDVDKFSSDLRPDHPGDDAFKTLTQEDLDNFNATQKDPAQNVPEQIVEFKHDDMKGISEDDFKTLTQEDVDMKETEADVESSDDATFVSTDVNSLTKKWTQLASQENIVKSNFKSEASSQSIGLKLFQKKKAEIVVSEGTSDPSDVQEIDPGKQKEAEKQYSENLLIHTQSGSSDQQNKAVSETRKKEKPKKIKPGRSHSVKGKPHKTHVQTSSPLYRFSNTKIKVMLPGIAPNNESSTDDVSQVVPAREPEKLEPEIKEVEQDEEETPKTENDDEPVDFKAAKRKFEALSRETPSTTKKVDRRSSFRSPKYAQRRSYIDIMKENHPSAASMMSIDYGEKEDASVSAMVVKRTDTDDSPETYAHAKQSEERKCHTDSSQETEEGKREFVEDSEYTRSGVINLGGTFSDLETASSTDTHVPVKDAVESILPNVFEMDTSESQGLSEQTETEFVSVATEPTEDVNRPTASNSGRKTNVILSKEKDSSEEEDEEFHDAKEFLSLNVLKESELSICVPSSDNDDTLYQTASEMVPNESTLRSNLADSNLSATLDDDVDDVFTTATGAQLASRLELVSVSEDGVISEDHDVSAKDPKGTSVSGDSVTIQVQRRHQPEPSPKNLRSPSRKISLLHRLSNRFSKTKRVSRSPGKLKKDMTEVVDLHLRGKTTSNHDIMEQRTSVELTKYSKLPMEEIANKLFEDKRPEELPKGKNKDSVQSRVNVTAMAEILASKFRGDEPVPTKKAPKIVTPLLAAKPESEFCVFCHKRVYIMERMSAEGVFFHRGCLKCDYCNTNLRLNNYSCDREINGEVKFYCYRHAHPDQRLRLKRKRIIYDDDGSKENIPTVVTMSMSKTGKDSVILPPQKKEETPKKSPPPLSPLQVPEDPYEKAKKTPERVEFENTFEGLEEESEEEQFEHNLRASFSSDMLLDGDDDIDESDTDSESGGEDDVLMDPTDSDISKKLTWEEACKLAESWSRRHSREDLVSAGVEDEGTEGTAYSRFFDEVDDEDEGDEEEEDEEDDTTEVEESETGTEDSTDVETEEEKSESREETGTKSDHTRSEGTFQDTGEDASPLKSPSISAVLSARANFFATPPEPVRIDAKKALGLEEQQARAAAGSVDEEPSDRTQTDKTDNQVSEISEFEQNPGHASDDGGTDEDVLDVDIEEEGEAKVARAMVDDEGEDADGEEEMETEPEGNIREDEDLDKTAVSRAMEQLLKDMDNRGSIDSDQGEGRVVATDSEEEEVEVFGEEGAQNKISEDTEQLVLRSVRDMRDSESEEGEEGGTLQQVLQDVKDMDREEQESNLGNIDDSFVTKRKKKKKVIPPSHMSDSDSSFTISTPSQNSSTSSLNDEVEYNRNFCDDDDDLKPDADMLRDYTMTLSTMLGESYSDSEMPSIENQEKMVEEGEAEANTTLQGDQSLNDSLRSGDDSLYLTPTVNASKDGQPPSSGSDVYLTPEVNAAKSEDGTPRAPDTKLSPKKLISTSTPEPPKKSESPTLVKKSNTDTSTKTTPPIKSKRIILSPVKRTEPDSKTSPVPKPTPRKSETKVSPLTSRISPVPTTRKSDSKVSPKFYTTKNDNKSPKLPAHKTETKGSPKPVPRKLPIPPSAQGQTPRSPSSRSRAATSTTSDSSSPSFSRQTTSSRAKWSDTDSRESSTSPAYSPAKTPKQTKTKISVDRNRLKSDSSSEIQTSDGAESSKKKIPLDLSLMKGNNPVNKSFEEIEDIPFADESELDERFYTPATSVKVRPAKVQKDDVGVRKRILPSPPRESSGVLSPNQIRDIQKAEKERNKAKAKDKPPQADDAVKGIQCVNKSFQNPVVPRQGKKAENSERDRRSMSYSSIDPSTSDMVTDSDDSRLYGLNTPTSSATETENVVHGSKEKKKKKSAESKSPKDKADKEKKHKSLLSKLLPSKSPEKSVKERSTTPTQANSSSVTKKKKTPKSDKKKRTKSKDLLDSSLSENLKDLKIGSVFTTELSKLPGNRHNFSSTMPMAPRAEVDDFSDSGESMMSTSTTYGRKNLNLTDKPDDRVSRRIQRAAVKQQKAAEQKRLRMAQEIQRKLEEVDVRQRELEQRGIIVEKALRGEGPDADKDEANLMQEWFNLVHDKNSLVRYESELMVRAKELELEDRQARLENQLRERMSASGDPNNKTDAEIMEEKQILDELLLVVEERDSLVAMLEEDRLREQEEDRDLEDVMSRKGYTMSPLSLPGREEALDVS